MKRMKKLLKRLQAKAGLFNALNLLAIATLISSVNSACNWLQYQPDMPEEAKKFRKF